MIRMLEVKSYTGFILDNPCWNLISNMLIISFHFMICSKSGEEIEVTSVRCKIQRKVTPDSDLV